MLCAAAPPTYIHLATVPLPGHRHHCYSKKALGWSVTDHMRTEIVVDPLKNEPVYRTGYATKSQARRDDIRYIEDFHDGLTCGPWIS